MTDQPSSRTFDRVPIRIDVEVRPEGGTPVCTKAHDLSFSGLSIRAEPGAFAKGTACEVELILNGGPDEIRLPGRGTVVRVQDGLVALSYSALDGDVYEHFERLVILNSPDPVQMEGALRSNSDAQPLLRSPNRG